MRQPMADSANTSAHRPSAPRALVTASLLSASLLSAAVLSACGGGGPASSNSELGGGSGLSLVVNRVSNGFGNMLPHTTIGVDANGDETGEVVTLRSVADVYQHVRLGSGLLPAPSWNEDARLPNGLPGNHFVFVSLSKAIDSNSVFDLTPAGAANNFLSGTIQITAFNGVTGTSEPVEGRAFIAQSNGAGGIEVRTPSVNVQPSGQHDLEAWAVNEGGVISIVDRDEDTETLDDPGHGFPGTEAGFQGVLDLFKEGVFIFVADDDGDLSTHDTFPDDRQIRVEIGTSVRTVDGDVLPYRALASSTVGPDDVEPRVGTQQLGIDVLPRIAPGNGVEDVDPETTVSVQFSEPVQPAELGAYDLEENFFEFGSAMTMTFGPQDFVTSVQYKVRVLWPYDLASYEFVPAYAFPGTGPEAVACGEYSQVDINVGGDSVVDQSSNGSSRIDTTFFRVGEGRVMTNAPVMPDVIYVGRTNPSSISVIDIAGFGGGTGNPAFDSDDPWKTGNSRFPLNPNVANGSTIVPPLSPGTCTFNGGSAGALTLARNSALETRLVSSPVIASVSDMAVGAALDLVFNNAPPPFGCQAGNPNACAASGLKNPAAVVQVPTTRPPQPGETSNVPVGAPNPISWAPHPNPPPITFPPLCISPDLAAAEPSSNENGQLITAPSPNNIVPNVLSPNGNPLGNPSGQVPPNGLWTTDQYVYFNGPSLPLQTIPCKVFGYRQQIGHFLYVADPQRGEVVVLNSNRMTVLERIKVPDARRMAMGPNLDLLAVTSKAANQVYIIDVLTSSPTFNQVIKVIDVGIDPVAIAWQPNNEDIIVCNQGDDTLSLIRVFDLEVRKTVGGVINNPIDIAVGPRHIPQPALGLARNTYFAFIANSDGKISIFESGPDGVGGWGPDSLVGAATQTFDDIQKIALDRTFLTGALWIAHRNPIDTSNQLPIGSNEGALSQLRVSSAVTGQIPVTATVNLTSRQLDLDVVVSVGGNVLSGAPVDLAFDCMMNIAAASANVTTAFSAPGTPLPVNGKSWERIIPGPAVVPSSYPTFLFAAIPNAGVVDVFRLQGGLNRVDVDVTQSGTQSIEVSQARVLCDYWRQ